MLAGTGAKTLVAVSLVTQRSPAVRGNAAAAHRIRRQQALRSGQKRISNGSAKPAELLLVQAAMSTPAWPLQRMRSVWACPRDRTWPLQLRDGAKSADQTAFYCPRCGGYYNVRDGIADFWLSTESGAALIEHERQMRERYLLPHLGRRQRFEHRVELDAVLDALRCTPEDRVLDAGCGVGAITRPLIERGASVVGVDFSGARLRYLQERLSPTQRERVLLAVADINHLPLVSPQFTRIVCTQVMQHLPAPELRQKFLKEVYALLSPGGRLVLTVYADTPATRRQGVAAEGFHETGIFYHRFQREELAQYFGQFRLLSLRGLVCQVPGSYRTLPWLGRAGRHLERWLEKRKPVSDEYAQVWMVLAERPAETPH